VVHQTALYDFVSAVVLFLVLVRLAKRAHYDGFIVLVFAAWYGAMRILEDFLREDVRHFGLTGSQWTAAVTVALCLYVLVFVRRTPRWGRWDEHRAAEDAPREETEWKSASE
jgi:prolipoprotein diacylglyceryltransferase